MQLITPDARRWPALFLVIGLLLFSTAQGARAQGSFTLSGTVRAAGGEALPGASVAVPALNTGTAADSVGHFRLTLPAGRYQVVVAFVGYEPLTSDVNLTRNQRFVYPLTPSENALDEVVVQGAQTLGQKLKTTQMGVEHLSIREAKLLPALFGEVDILKTLQLKPGVQPGGEGTSGLFVRGGSADQNLFLVDNATVYNPSHLFGLFSVFNSDAVQSVDLYKAGFPAQFGGRLSSVVDVKLREGDRQNYHVTGGLGLISSRLTFEGPINKGKGSFILSGRRTYFDIFTRAYNRANVNKEDFTPIPDYYFYDLNFKANYTLGPKDNVYLSAYLGRDKFGFSGATNGFNFNFDWGNTLATLRWNHVFNPRLLVNTTATITDYQYNLTNKLDQFSFNLGSSIRDYALRTDFEYVPNDRHTIKFGAAATAHRFGVGRLQAGSGDGSVNFGADVGYTASEGALYVGDNFRASDKLQIDAGLRLSAWHSGTNNYAGLEPRLSARYSLSDNVSLKASYALMYQYVHLVTNSGATLPTDIWYPSRLSVKPQRSQQASTGVSFLLGGGKFLLTDEVYYKWGKNQIDFKDGAQLFVNPELDTEFLFGKSWSYGNELYLEKKTGKTTGWVGYTLAWAWLNIGPQRGTTGVNNGQDYHPNYDRRHNLTVVVLHQLNTRFTLTASYIYTSGNLTTLPLGRFGYQDINGSNVNTNEGNTTGGTDPRPIPIYPDRNSFRLIPYARLDLGLVYKLRPTQRGGERDFTFSVYNATNRRNAYFDYFETVRDKTTDRITGFRAQQVSLFPFIPSVTYNFKF
ncbi:TonB-dependent receptor [Hymenobacter coccineus]|uniref:TonB-dependent receptor n=1 Tax=Hymenobacter coccineus TaxID=1908235 RepID=A0A1G1THU1_9BACT|nr:TonB-dependent receptor [Hymenobacter coccineus]OGX90456.1 TonB-dependent receptor [Hymenobacter coccineus]